MTPEVTAMTTGHAAPLVVGHEHGELADLGVVTMRRIVAMEQTRGAWALVEFRGREGAWTVPHIHDGMEESFYVLEGGFAFTVGDREIEASRGDFVMVPRGTRHLMRAHPGGGALLTLFTPGGLEKMFLELGTLPRESITDPKVRAQISKRHDSRPV
jgi:quercetin dioxygenase-like cupin family protein